MADTSLASDSTSPASFHTARTSEVDCSEITNASSPVHGQPCPYRDARPLPRELKDHCQIFLEEQLYTCAINLLNSILGSGVSRRKPSPRHAGVPPPSHLALINSLIVHPLHTTRAEKLDHLDVSSLALDYLRNLLLIVGPVNADFRTAFQFRSSPRWSRRSTYGRGSDGDMSDADSDRDYQPIHGKMATAGSVWSRGQDFWSTVGWALSCSALHPQRWRYWKAWLEFMLDVLDADWTERDRRDSVAHNATGNDENEAPTTWRQDSMIQKYMDESNGRAAGSKRVLKALFADGSNLSNASFHEVFEKELKGPKKSSKKRKRDQVLDLDNDKFADYFDDDSISSGVSEPPTPQKRREAGNDSSSRLVSTCLAESIEIRLRLFKLISRTIFTLGKTSDLNKLYEDYAAALKVLPLPLFSLFVTQRPNPLLLETHITISKELFHLFLPSSYKDPRKVDPKNDAKGYLTTPMLEHCYIPLAANTISFEDNAKLSLLVENSIQLLWICDMLDYTDSFAEAAEKGISTRLAKAKKKRTGKTRPDDGETLAADMLNQSTDRIRILLDALKEFNSSGD